MNIDSLLLTAPDFRAKMTEVLAYARTKLLEDPSDSYMPTLFVWHLGDGGEVKQTLMLLSGIDFDDNRAKYAQFAALGASFHGMRQAPLAAVMISEMWRSREKPGDKHVQPRDHPDREEALSAAGATIDKKHQLMASIPIARVRGIMRPCSADWQWVEGDVETNLLNQFFAGFMKEAAEKIGFNRGENQ
jgi:hypothetical protein